MNRQHLKTVLVVLLSVSALGLSSAYASEQVSTLQEILKRGTVIVGVNAYIKPLEFTHLQTGEIVGMIPDLVSLYAKKLDVKLQYNDYKWPGFMAALETKKVDFLAGTLTTTIPRTAKVDFVHPYLYTGARVLVRKGLGISKLADLNSEKINFGQTKGSIYIRMVESRFPKAKIQQFDTFVDNLQAMKVGRVDAILEDEINVLFRGLAENEDKLAVLEENLLPQTLSFAVRLGDYELRRSLDIFFQEIKLNGEYKEIYEKWMGKKWEPRNIGY